VEERRINPSSSRTEPSVSKSFTTYPPNPQNFSVHLKGPREKSKNFFRRSLLKVDVGEKISESEVASPLLNLFWFKSRTFSPKGNNFEDSEKFFFQMFFR